jgi:hypothetical protein
MISRRENFDVPHGKRCNFSAFFGVSLDDNVDGSKMMRPEEVLFSEKVVLPLR